MKLLREIEERFGGSRAKARVALELLRHGLSVREAPGWEAPRVFLGGIEVPYKSVARACGVDWRTVKETLIDISRDPFLRELYGRLENAGPFLRGVAKLLRYRCIVVETVRDQPGILAYVSGLLAERGINILQVVAEHPLLVESPKLYVIIEGEVPGDFVPRVLQHPAIKSVTVY
jgi:predicted regulator of amino acid metabolism with ACT domain